MPGGRTKLRLVEIISDSEVAKLLSDPMRRAILNLLRGRPMAESELADALGLSDASINYHLVLLRKAGLIRISKKEIEEHGILKKFYEPTAYLYLADVGVLPRSVARYYFPVDLERVRATLSMMSDEEFTRMRLTGSEVDSLGDELSRTLISVARGYQDQEVDPAQGEQMVYRIYSESIAVLLKSLRK